ncbi:MAG: response regulator [Gammaproteobacteria bacterium]|nr:MAG: response regulator [Gammaproteobacteria bacterium]
MNMTARKCALIVDDSRTAREALGRVLRQHQLRVEMAESAEDALAQLGDFRPDVIFMDHLMPGMDGFQAVRVIKNNPATATIPIMMYTSQAGELYVGQARALGAVGVLPKQIKPVQVSETLEQLNLLPVAVAAPVVVDLAADEGVTTEIVAEADVARPLSEVEQMMEPADWGELHRWFEQMLQHHGQVMRTDIEISVARLLRENAGKRSEQTSPVPSGIFARELKSLGGLNATTLLVAALSLFAATFFWMYVKAQRDFQAVYEQNVELLNVLQVDRLRFGAADPGSAQFAGVDVTSDSLSGILPDLEWSANQFAAYGSGEIPLGDQRLDLIDGLVKQLRSVGFSGVIEIDSHVGDFCDVRGENGVYRSAPADMPVADCDRVGMSPGDAQLLSAKQSVAFANYLAAIERDEAQDIRIHLNTHGNSNPLYAYPARSREHTAGEWNRIARQNNRVRVRLLAVTDASWPATDSFTIR